MRLAVRFTAALVLLLLFGGWGGVGHKIINTKTTEAFPYSMNYFVKNLSWSTNLGSHASDADNRKGSDPTEGQRHFLDIENFPEFMSTGTLYQDYNYNLTLHGAAFMKSNGTLPWTIFSTVDSVQYYFAKKDFNNAMLKAADLGHYVGDGHQPLHITANYDGAQTNQSGIHLRYETTMVGKDTAYLTQYTLDTAVYISDKVNYIFNFVYLDHKYADTVLKADSISKALTGSTSTTAYYNSMWSLTGTLTTMLMKTASQSLADLIYTAWVDAGSPQSTLPVEMVSFTSSVNGNKVQLNWRTSTETNNRGFEVLRASESDMESWQSVAFIAGKGTTTNAQNYTYTDKNLNPGKYFYRIKQMDFDGTFAYSNEVEADINGPQSFYLYQNYPNPFNPSTVISYSLSEASNVKLEIFDALGRKAAELVNEVQPQGLHKVDFNSAQYGLTSGVYFTNLTANGITLKNKMMLIK